VAKIAMQLAWSILGTKAHLANHASGLPPLCAAGPLLLHGLIPDRRPQLEVRQPPQQTLLQNSATILAQQQ